MTIAVQIGNSDDRLPQRQWSQFVVEVGDEIRKAAKAVHFSGAPFSCSQYQNFAFIFEADEEAALTLKIVLTAKRKQYNQDSLAWTVGETTFV